MSELSTLLRAVAFAAEKHRHQRRKGKEKSPYINHPIEVASMIAETGTTDRTTLVAAILHDTLEDTKTTRRELEKHFGKRVSAIVREVTDNKKLEKQRRKDLQLQRAPRLSRAAKMIRIADKTCNVRDILERPPSDWSVKRKWEYIGWARKMVDACRDANPRLAANFDRMINATSTAQS